MHGDQVLLKQNKTNKLSATFKFHPHEVVGRKGNEVMIQSPDVE